MSEPGAVTGAVLASQAASIERGQEAALIDGERWVLELVARGVPFDTVLTALARLIEAITGDGLIASIMLLDDDGATIRVGAAPGLPAAYCRQIDGVAIGPAAGSCGTAAYLGEPVIVSDIATDPLWDDYRHLALPQGLAACWSTPIFSTEGRLVIGTLAFYYREPRAPNPAHLRLAAMVSRTAAVVIERARAEAARDERETERERLLAAERDARAAAEKAHRLLAAQQRIGQVLEGVALGDVPSHLIRVLCDILGWTCGAFWEVRNEDAALRCAAVWHGPNRSLQAFDRATLSGTFRRGEGLPGRVWETGRPVWIADLSQDAAFVRAAAAARAGLRAALAFPVLSGGRVVAVVECFGAAVRQREEESLASAAALGPQIGQYIERRRADQALRESEARFRELFENAPVGYQELDSDGRFVRVNRALCELLGYGAEELLGRRIWDFEWAQGEPPEETRRKFFDKLSRADPWRAVERVRVRKDGSLRTVWVEDMLVRDAAGRVTGLRSTQIDITERKAAETERDRLYAAERAARAEVEAALASRDRFIASVSHDLQNPLGAIKGYAQLARRQAAGGAPAAAERIATALATIESTAQRMSLMIGELLDATRLEAGVALELRRRPVDLVQLADEAVRFQRAVAAGHEIRLEAAVSSVWGEWDRERLERVVANLLENAIKYSPGGGEIVITVARDADDAVVAVRDNGLGIPAADLPHVFERYRRGANVAEKIAGTGLGLASAHEIVALHGGSIAVESEEGGGSTFTVRLPLIASRTRERSLPETG